jgi:hypothetical protein
MGTRMRAGGCGGRWGGGGGGGRGGVVEEDGWVEGMTEGLLGRKRKGEEVLKS